MRPRSKVLVLVLGIAAAATGVAVAVQQPSTVKQALNRATTGDLETIHSAVSINGEPSRGIARVAEGDTISTELSGRARLRLAEGVTALLDVSSELRLDKGVLSLTRGRLFVDSPEGRVISVRAGDVDARVTAAKVAMGRDPKQDRTHLYCAQGEVMLSQKGAPSRVESGESATVANAKLTIEPEKAFEDWTGGLAVPWETKQLSRSALPEVWSRSDDGEPEGSLHISAEEVGVVLNGELAVTKTRTRYYNGQDRLVTPTVRLALPPSAQLTNVEYALTTSATHERAQVRVCQSELVRQPSSLGLEWSGNGWLSGKLPQVSAGGSIDLILEYSEWLPSQGSTTTYRYPMGASSGSPVIGELSVKIDAERTQTPFLNANASATVEGKKLSWQAADARPNDDWVVTYAPSVVKAGVARAYVQTLPGEADPYLMVRAETPSEPALPVRLGVVVDASRSMGATGLDLARSVVDALLGNLSARDSVLVMTADERSEPVGGPKPLAATAELAQKISTELWKSRSQGATHLAAALQQAADRLDGAPDASAYRSMLVYVGDGRPTLGELTSEGIRKRLGNRAGGVPRLSAVAIGAQADRWLLSRVVAGAGPVDVVLDRSEAARVAERIMAAAEEPVVADVRFDLGPTVDRLYPREARAVTAGTTATVFGRLRGPLPRSIGLILRDGHTERSLDYRVEGVARPEGADVARRWAERRVEDLALGNEGLEPALLLAQQHALLVPFTGWFFSAGDTAHKMPCTKFDERVVELSSLSDTPWAHRIVGNPPPNSGWLEPPTVIAPGESINQASALHARATVEKATTALVGCRDARLGMGTTLPATLTYLFTVGTTGKADQIRFVEPAASPQVESLFACARRVIGSLSFYPGEGPVQVQGRLVLPPPPRERRTKCSMASTLPLPVRRGIWLNRNVQPITRYVNALQSCELGTWTERRALLDQLLDMINDGVLRLNLAAELAQLGYQDAATYVRDETVKRVASLQELEQVRSILLELEPKLDAELATRVKRATTDDNRLEVVRKVLALAPHSPLGQRLFLLLLENLGKTEELGHQADRIRSDPFSDAGLLAISASTLRRLGQLEAGRGAYFELLERAPSDPWVLGFAGDSLRHGGLFDDAISAYESLNQQLAFDSTTLLRLGLVEAQAGRVDIATRLLDRTTQIGGRKDDERIASLASIVRAVVLEKAQAESNNEPEKRELARRLAETPLPDVETIILVEAPAGIEEGMSVLLYRGDDKTGTPAELDASPLGLAAMLVDQKSEGLRVEVKRRTWAGLARPLPVEVTLLERSTSPESTEEVEHRTLRARSFEVPRNEERAEVSLP
jgi:tetratricopeptide (TPR) repeat protein